MDTPYYFDGMQHGREVASIVAKHSRPGFVLGYEVEFDETWDGFPAVRVNYYTPVLYDPTEEEVGQLNDLARAVTAEIRQVVPDRAVYVHFLDSPGKGS